MKKFIVLYHVPAEAMAQTMNASPEQQAEGMKAWMDWAQRAGSHLVDLGAPLTSGTVIKNDWSDGPSTRDVSGYSILEAENLEEAKNLLKGHPHIGPWSKDATIEIHETMQIPGM